MSELAAARAYVRGAGGGPWPPGGPAPQPPAPALSVWRGPRREAGSRVEQPGAEAGHSLPPSPQLGKGEGAETGVSGRAERLRR